jgi:DnaK suppressor protein
MGVGEVDFPANCPGQWYPEYAPYFDPQAVDLRSIFWLPSIGSLRQSTAALRPEQVIPLQVHFEKGVRGGYAEGGQTFSAARIGRRGDSLMSRKDAILNMRQILIKRRDALRKALAGDLSLLKELRAQTSGDMVDAALDSVQDEISSQLAEVESRELTRIEYALERMREGQFGICEGCGTNIPMARLNALPYATYCITCQREAERQGAGSAAEVDWSRLLDSSGETDLSINDIELDVS